MTWHAQNGAHAFFGRPLGRYVYHHRCLNHFILLSSLFALSVAATDGAWSLDLLNAGSS